MLKVFPFSANSRQKQKRAEVQEVCNYLKEEGLLVAGGGTRTPDHLEENDLHRCVALNLRGIDLADVVTIPVIPALWCNHSFNQAAGMFCDASDLPAFVRWNMPLGSGGLLTDQQAWDLEAFIHSKPPPAHKSKPPQRTGKRKR